METSPQMSPHCPKCDAVVNETAVFCPKCGHKLKPHAKWVKVVSDAQLQEDKVKRAKEMPRSRGRAGAVLSLAGFVFVFLSFLLPRFLENPMGWVFVGFGIFLLVLGVLSLALSDYMRHRLETKGEVLL